MTVFSVNIYIDWHNGDMLTTRNILVYLGHNATYRRLCIVLASTVVVFHHLCCYKLYSVYLLVCFWRNRPPVDQGLLLHEDSRSHTTTHPNR